MRGQSDPELKKYLWVVIRTQKDRKLQTLIEVCTDFARFRPSVNIHRPTEQTFAAEEDEGMMNRSQWTGQGISEPNVPPSLAQMFALAKRMGYEMRPVAHRSNQPSGSPRAPFTSGQGYRQPFRQGHDFSKVKCFSCGQKGHTQARCPKPDATLPFKPPCWNMQSDGQQQRNNNSPPGKHHLDRDLTQTGLNAIHWDIDSSSLTNPSKQTSYSDLYHSTKPHTTDTVDGLAVRFGSQDTADRTTDSSAISDRSDKRRVEPTWTGPLLDVSDSNGDDHVDDAVLQISGAGHWFLEGWIGDHSVEFLEDLGSSVTAMSDSLYQTLGRAGAPVGTFGCTSRTLCGANGTGIGSGCSHCVASFMGLLTEFPILVCDLAAGMDAIIGTDVLGSVLPHTLDIKNGLLFIEGGASLQLHRRNDALFGRVFTVGHCSVPP